MADIDVTIGLDYQKYKQGLRDVERSSDRTASTITRAFRFAVISRAARESVSIAGSAMREYAKDNERAQRVVERWEALGRKMQRAIGEGLVDAIDTALPMLESLTDRITAAQRATVDYLAGAIKWISGDQDSMEEIRRQQAIADAQDREFRRRMQAFDYARKHGDELADRDLARAKAAGRDTTPIEADIIRRDYERRRRDLPGYLSPQQRQLIERSLRAEERADIDALTAGRSEAFLRQHGNDVLTRDIARARRSGDETIGLEAEMIRREYEQRKRDLPAWLSGPQRALVERSLDSEQRMDIEALITDRRRTAEEGVERARRGLGSRTLEVGLGGDRFIAARAGIGGRFAATMDPVADAVRKVEQVQEQGNKILQRIEQNTRTSTARAG